MSDFVRLCSRKLSTKRAMGSMISCICALVRWSKMTAPSKWKFWLTWYYVDFANNCKLVAFPASACPNANKDCRVSVGYAFINFEDVSLMTYWYLKSYSDASQADRHNRCELVWSIFPSWWTNQRLVCQRASWSYLVRVISGIHTSSHSWQLCKGIASTVTK